ARSGCRRKGGGLRVNPGSLGRRCCDRANRRHFGRNDRAVSLHPGDARWPGHCPIRRDTAKTIPSRSHSTHGMNPGTPNRRVTKSLPSIGGIRAAIPMLLLLGFVALIGVLQPNFLTVDTLLL